QSTESPYRCDPRISAKIRSIGEIRGALLSIVGLRRLRQRPDVDVLLRARDLDAGRAELFVDLEIELRANPRSATLLLRPTFELEVERRGAEADERDVRRRLGQY